MSRFGWKQRALIIPPLLLGSLFLALAPSMKAEPTIAKQTAGKKVVRVLKVTPRNIQPTAIGYGHTKPAYEWEAQSELDGTVTWITDELRDGTVIAKNTTVLRLDPSAYELSISRLQAEIEVTKLKDKTILESLKIAEMNYHIQKAEYERSVRLSKTGSISETEKDRANRELLNSQQQLQSLKNSLIINQAERQVLEAQLDLAERDLQHTEIKAPFDLRITEKMVGIAEYVSKGEILFKADGIDAVEVNVQFPLGKMRPLRRSRGQDKLSNTIHSDLEAKVELKAGDKTITWQARVDRSGGTIDAQTQSQSIVVTIDNPYEQAVPGQKPPLIRDTFVKVTLKAPVLKNQTIIPVNAIHNGNVYIVNSEGKLEFRPIEVDFVQEQIVVIRSGLKPDDRVVLSRLFPAVEGMSLKPQPDKNIEEWLNKTTGFNITKAKKREGKS